MEPKIISYAHHKPMYEKEGRDWPAYLQRHSVGGRYGQSYAIRARWIIMKVREALIEGTNKSIPEMLDEVETCEAKIESLFSVDRDTKAKIRLGKYNISYYLMWVRWEISYFISEGLYPKHTDHISEDMKVTQRATL